MRRERLTVLIRRYLQALLQSLQNFISHLRCGDTSAEVLRPEPETTDTFLIEDTPDRGLDGLSGLIQPHGIPQQQGGAEDRSDRVRNTLPGNIGGRTVDGFI